MRTSSHPKFCEDFTGIVSSFCGKAVQRMQPASSGTRALCCFSHKSLDPRTVRNLANISERRLLWLCCSEKKYKGRLVKPQSVASDKSRAASAMRPSKTKNLTSVQCLWSPLSLSAQQQAVSAALSDCSTCMKRYRITARLDL